MIEVNGITKYYGTFRALDDVSFNVARGEVLGFLGPNGAGKSTTMKVLTTFISASEGTARVAGFDVHAQPHEVRRKLGYLPETPPLYGDMTVEDYLAFSGRARGLKGGDLKHRLDAVIDETGLVPKRKSRITELSKGYRQRTGIAQALIHNPDVLVLDEPTSGLDPMQIIEIRKLIDRLRETKCIIFSTHILQEATAVASRLVIISGGRKVADGTADDLAARTSDRQKVRLLVRGGEEMLEALRGIKGVAGVDPVNPPAGYSRFELITTGGVPGARTACERISDLCVLHGAKIAELAPQALTLEDIFLQLLQGKSSVSGAGTALSPQGAALPVTERLPARPATQVPPAPEARPAPVAPVAPAKPVAKPRAETAAWDVIDASLNADVLARPKPKAPTRKQPTPAAAAPAAAASAAAEEMDADPFATSIAGPPMMAPKADAFDDDSTDQPPGEETEQDPRRSGGQA